MATMRLCALDEILDFEYARASIHQCFIDDFLLPKDGRW
jgi:hypothetical protein